MIRTSGFVRNLALAGAVTLLAGASAFAQDRDRPRSTRDGGNRGYANRTVEGTVASVEHDRSGGDRVRLTNGMDLLVPKSITGVNRGRRYGAATLRRGDVVRLEVYSREGDGRDAVVRSLEILDTYANNDRRMNGTVVSVNRRERTLVMQTDRGQTLNVDFKDRRSNDVASTFRRGDRISVSGRLDRGIVMADDIRLRDDTRR
jgi:hypothetical protein